MKRVLLAILALVITTGLSDAKKHKYDVAAFVWPAYYNDARYAEIGVFPDGVGEWESVYNAKPKFEGHKQPKTPLWGYRDESDPKVQKKVISKALKYGVNTFIFDWYWYNDKPFLEDALNKGFLGASNNRKMKFYLMWANHIMTSYLDSANPDKSIAYWKEPVTQEVFDHICDHVIKDYFMKPNYYKIDGRPVFAIYETSTFIYEMGGEEAALAALEKFNQKCIEAGFPGVHIQPILWFKLPATRVGDVNSQNNTVHKYGFRSLTNYQWCHLAPANSEYTLWGDAATAYWEKFSNDFDIPYFPHVSIGWDPNPRYPEGVQPCVTGSSPEKFEVYLRKAKAYLDARPDQPQMVTINAWNEWAEGSCLEPDTETGYGYLEAVRRVFK